MSGTILEDCVLHPESSSTILRSDGQRPQSSHAESRLLPSRITYSSRFYSITVVEFYSISGSRSLVDWIKVDDTY